MKEGFTTGTCAAAAAKAGAIGIMEGRIPENVQVTLPSGKNLPIKINKGRILQDRPTEEKTAIASVIKDAGDDPDVTDGIEIIAKIIYHSKGSGFKIIGGKGVGRVTLPGLQIPVGEPAINPVPRKMIERNVREIISSGSISVEISVPKGEVVAKNTFNKRLGILGGISILGTTGIVVPMSLEAIKATIKCEIDVLCSTGKINPLYLVPGKIGEKGLKTIMGKDIRVVQMSNFIGEALQYAKKKGVKEIVMGGHPGKLSKILMGYLYTHSSKSPMAVEYVTEYLGIRNHNFNTVEEIIRYVRENPKNTLTTFHDLARDIAIKIKEIFGFQKVQIILMDMNKIAIGRAIV